MLWAASTIGGAHLALLQAGEAQHQRELLPHGRGRQARLPSAAHQRRRASICQHSIVRVPGSVHCARIRQCLPGRAPLLMLSSGVGLYPLQRNGHNPGELGPLAGIGRCSRRQVSTYTAAGPALQACGRPCARPHAWGGRVDPQHASTQHLAWLVHNLHKQVVAQSLRIAPRMQTRLLQPRDYASRQALRHVRMDASRGAGQP